MRDRVKVLTTLLLLGALATFAGCSQEWLGPVQPVQPVVPVDPRPAPVDPVTPPPAPATVVPYATISAVPVGASKADVLAAIGVAPTLESRQDDGTTTARWATVNATGEPRWAVVTFDAGGNVIGHVLIPRST